MATLRSATVTALRSTRISWQSCNFGHFSKIE
jgi:hypothetical protein